MTDTSSSSSLIARELGDSNDNAPLNEIVIRKWDLNENSTHYDRLVAAPSDEDLVKFWAGWASIMLTTAVLTTAIWIPLVVAYFSKTKPNNKVQKNPFNLYLVFLLTPDMLVAWTCGITCLTNALAGHFTSEFMCYFQSWYMIASICANSWLNAVVAYQLYTMLSSAQRFIRYHPPTTGQVYKHAAAVYLYSCFLASWGLIRADWWPHKTRLTIGSACIPMDYSEASTVFFYCVFFPLLFGLPLVYVCWTAYQIYKHQMLPPSGRRRLLAIYFLRLAFVFLVMWLPGLLLLFVTGAWLDPWVEWVGGSWSHLQGAVSALVSLLKPDIWTTVRDFWTCGRLVDETESKKKRSKKSKRGSGLVLHNNDDHSDSSSWFTAFGLTSFGGSVSGFMGSTRASIRSSMKLIGGSFKQLSIKRSGSKQDLMADLGDMSDSDADDSGSVVIQAMDNVLAGSSEFTTTHAPSDEGGVSQNSLRLLQMFDDSSSSSSSSDDDDDDSSSPRSFITDEMRSLQSLRNIQFLSEDDDSSCSSDDGDHDVELALQALRKTRSLASASSISMNSDDHEENGEDAVEDLEEGGRATICSTGVAEGQNGEEAIIDMEHGAATGSAFDTPANDDLAITGSTGGRDEGPPTSSESPLDEQVSTRDAHYGQHSGCNENVAHEEEESLLGARRMDQDESNSGKSDMEAISVEDPACRRFGDMSTSAPEQEPSQGKLAVFPDNFKQGRRSSAPRRLELEAYVVKDAKAA